MNESEDWYAKADPEHVEGGSCEAVPNCPAPHAGFVTKGDNNDRYDQVEGISRPVRPFWISGTAEYNVPYLGRVRLAFGRFGPGTDVAPGGAVVPDGPVALGAFEMAGTVAPAWGATHTSRTSTNATSIEPVSSTWTTAEPRTPTTA